MRITSPSTHAVLYARVSSKDQEREGFSIPAQQKLLRGYAEEHRLTVAREFVDVETAKQAGRAHFGAMIAFLKATPSCRTILVEKTDRLYRNFRDYVTLEDLQVTIHFVKEHAVLGPDSRSSDKLMHNIKVAMAKNYVDNLSEEVRKGLREKAEQGHWPGVAHVGYVNNRLTRRIDVDPARGPLVAQVFDLYASGEYSLKVLAQRAYEIGLRHWRGDRRMTTSEIHRMLRNPIYTGDFRWCGSRRKGSHQPLITHDIFNRVQTVLGGTSRPRKARRYAFMGLLTCAKCGCSLTAEMKKGRYVYYHCTNFRGRCDNTYIREERLGELLGNVIKPIHISTEIADAIARVLQGGDLDARSARADTLRRLDHRRRMVVAKHDHGYDDFSEGRISLDFWTRKSEAWEAELRTIAAEQARLDSPRVSMAVTSEKILELAKQAENLYNSQDPSEQRRLLETVLSNCTFDRGNLTPTYTSPFDLLVKGNQTGNWRREWDSNPR